MGKFEEARRPIQVLIRWCLAVAGVSVLAMLVLAIGNMVGRLFDKPIIGTFEIIEYISVVATSFGLAYTQLVRGHVSVSFVVQRLPLRTQTAIEIVTLSISALLAAVVCWQSVGYGFTLWHSHEVSQTLRLPFFVFVFGMAFGSMVFCIELSTQCIESVVKVVGKWT